MIERLMAEFGQWHDVAAQTAGELGVGALTVLGAELIGPTVAAIRGLGLLL